MPDLEGAVQESQVQSSQPAQEAAPVASPASQPPPQPSSPGPSLSSQAPSAPSWRDQLVQRGINVQGDDNAVMQTLAQAYREAQQFQQVRPYVDGFMQHRAEFAEWMRSRQQQGQAPQAPSVPEKKPYWADYWAPPQYDRSIEQFLRKDADGNIVALPGAPPDAVIQYQTYHAWRNKQAQAMLDNPHQFIEPTARNIAKEVAEQAIREHLGAYQDKISAQQFTQQNGQWLYEYDQNGQIKTNPVFNPATGQVEHHRVLNQWGAIMRDEIQRVAERQQKYGYSDIREQQDIATMRAQLAFTMNLVQQQAQAMNQAQQAQQQPMQPQRSPLQQSNQAFLQQQQPAPASRRAGSNSKPATTPVNKDLMGALRRDFQANGITDAAFGRK